MKTIGHFIKFFLHLEQPSSQVTEKELHLLLQYARQTHVIVELGSFEGRTAAALARATQGTVYSIDPFIKGRLGICYGEWIARIYCKRENIKNLQLLKGFSYDMATHFEKEIDLLFIDADHSYEAIKRDWRDWFPKLRRHGVIALHDCKPAVNSTNPLGTMDFYKRDIPSVKGIQELEGVDSLALFQVKR